MLQLKVWQAVCSLRTILQMIFAMTLAAATSANSLFAQQVLPDAPNSLLAIQQDYHCEHVIALMIRNRVQQQTGAFGAELAPGLILTVPPTASQLGDLELLDVHLVVKGSSALGPVVQVTMRNNRPIPVGNFQISIVAILGQIHNQCPTVRGLVSHVAAGSVSQFQLQLPPAAMAIGLPGQPLAPFDTIVVAVDSFDELVEDNELNNLRIIRRCDLAAIPMAAENVSVTPTQPAPSGLEAPAANPPTDTAIPSPAQPISPLDSLMLEDNTLESTQPTASGMSEFFRGAT